MSDYRVASRYAKSLLSLAIDQKIEDRLKDDMQLIADTCEQSRDLIIALKNPIIKYDKKLHILKRLFDKKVNSLIIRFMELLTKKNRAAILPGIADTWIELYNEHKNIIKANIISSAPISAAAREKVISVVKSATKKNVVLEEKIDQDLIGGFILNVKDQQLDNSVAGQLKQLKRKFLT